MDELVSQGTSFPNVYVENSLTTPSFASIFTGKYSGNHGVIGMVGVKLNAESVTMAEIFSANGYNTYAEATGPLNPLLGYDRGFSHYHFRNQAEYFFSDWGDNLLRRMQSGAFEPPYFLMVHFWEVHVPRQVPPEFEAPEYGETAYDRSVSALDAYIGKLVDSAGQDTAMILTGDHGECVGERPGDNTLLPYFLDKLNLPSMDQEAADAIDTTVDLLAEKPRLHQFVEELSETARRKEGKMGWKQRLMMMVSLLLIGITRYRIQMRSRKKGGAGFFANLRQKLDDVKLFLAVAMGRPEAAQLQMVKTSLNDHKLQHGYHIYDYLQRVPVVFVREGLFPSGHTVTTDVRHIDLLPTMIQAFGLQWADDSFDGRAYFDLMKNGGGKNRSIYLEARSGAQAEKVFLIRGVRRNRRKIAYAPFESQAPVEYYDLSGDPQETHNLSGVDADGAGALREEAEAMGASFAGTAGPALSVRDNKEMIKKLKDLGYM
jgi:arylsulfatase A-like enzyme